MADTSFDALDRNAPQTRAAERAQREREEKSLEQLDVIAMMSEPYGRRLVHRLLAQAGVFAASYTQGDPHHTAFREGARNVGNWLLAQVVAETPEQYALMLKEQSDVRT